MKKEIRAYYVPEELKIRAVDEDDSEGIFEGYAVVWDSTDSHKTRFVKGSFTKTLKERGDRVKILYQHQTDEPIGKPLELREDDVGLFVRGKLTGGVRRADETRKNIEAEVIDTLSFGFNTVSSKAAGQFRDITEVKLYEISPVTFASNDQAKITGFRAEDFVEADNEPGMISMDELKVRIEEARKAWEAEEEKRAADLEALEADSTDTETGDQDDEPLPPQLRATDFAESLLIEELYDKGMDLNWALRITLSDIWWENDLSNEETMALLDTALAQHSVAYLKWAGEFIERFWEERHSVMDKKDLASTVKLQIREMGTTIEKLAAETSLTATELTTLSRGNLLPMESRQAHYTLHIRYLDT